MTIEWLRENCHKKSYSEHCTCNIVLYSYPPSCYSVQGSLSNLEELEKENVELVNLVEGMRTQCQSLESKITQLDHQLNEVQEELSSAETRLVNADVDKSQMDEENRALQLLLIQKEEMLTEQEEQHSLIESQLHDYQHQHTVRLVTHCTYIVYAQLEKMVGERDVYM